MKLIPDDANILVCTDLDEVFDPGWADILRQNWTNEVNRAYYKYAWSHTEQGEPTDIFAYDKIHDRNYKWIYPVHEVLGPINKEDYTEHFIDCMDTIFLHHHQDKTKSRSSYFELLKLSAEENPDDAHVQMLLAREYLLNGDYSKSLEEYLNNIINSSFPDITLKSFNVKYEELYSK